MVHLINYSHNAYKKSQKKNSITGLKFGEFDWVHQYNFEMIPNYFINNNKDILSFKRGAGYWIWKPYIIWQTLNLINLNDYVFYCDSGAYFTNSHKPSLNLMQEMSIDVMCYELDYFHYERKWCKSDARILLNANDLLIMDTPQIMSGHIFLKNTTFTRELISKWLTYAQDIRIVSDNKSVLAEENYDFVENRHDQTIWSILCKKNKILPFKDPSGIVLEENTSYPTLARSKFSKWIENPRCRD